MALELAIVPFTTRTTSGTQQITSGSLTNWDDGGLVIFFLSGATSTNSITNVARYALGFADHAGNAACTSGRINNGTGTQNGRTEASQVDPLCLIDESASASDVVAQFSAALTNGIELNYTTVDGNAYQGVAIFIGGLGSALVGFLGGAGAGSGSAVDGLNEADLIFFSGEDAGFSSVAGDPQTTNGADLSFGAVLNRAGFPQACCASEFAFLGAAPSASGAIARTNRAATGWPNSATDQNLLITDIDATGFDWTVNAGSLDCPWAALIFPVINGLKNSHGLALETISAGAGNKSFTGLGIRPKILIGFANHVTSDNTVETGTGASGHALFVTDGVTSRSISWSSQDNVATTLTRSRAGTEPLAILGDAGTLDTQASFVSFDGSGFTLNFSSSAGGRMFVLGIGEIPSPLVRPRARRIGHRRRIVARLRRFVPLTFAPTHVFRPSFWKSILRNRRIAQQRRRWKPLVPGREIFVGEPTTEESKGRIFTPGLVRGRISGAGTSLPDDE